MRTESKAWEFTRYESPEEYAQRRANETGRPYLVTMMGHGWLNTRENVRLAKKDCGGIAGVFRPEK